jgi:serine/threonine-protein kinase
MEKRRFRFLKKLSEGTFGKVYLAEIITDSKFSKVVAIKLLHAKWADHDEIIKRSRDEARVLGRLQHRNIIKVEGLISIGGKCAIIMEYLNGVDLKTLINFCAKNRIRIPRKVIFETISSVASALDAAYNRPPLQGGDPLRLIHRDIKPSNIMVTVEADVKVLDFGTAQAKFEDREAETQALAFGSAAYMSPERFLGDEDRLSGDVYALGVTLYELLYQGRYGKANVRQEKYEEEQARRLEKLDLSDFSPEIADRIVKLLAGMLKWEELERSSLAHILQEIEELV